MREERKLNSLIFVVVTFWILNTRVKIETQRRNQKCLEESFSVGFSLFVSVQTNNPVTSWLQYATMPRTATA